MNNLGKKIMIAGAGNTVKYFQSPKIIAIDPGASGGIAVFLVNEKRLIEVVPMPETPTDMLNFISKWQVNSICYLEKVQGLPGMAGSAMFNFGKNYGYLEMALLARKIKTVTVTPQVWQKALQLGTKGGRSGTQWKNHLKAKAQQLFPNQKITLKTADALLLLEYARLKEKL